MPQKSNTRTSATIPERSQADGATLEGQVHPRKIYIGGLTDKTTSQHLSEYFAYYGDVANSVVIRWPCGRSRGFGFVMFTDKAGSSAALGTHEVCGREVVAERALLGKKKRRAQGLQQDATVAEPTKRVEDWRSWPHSPLVCLHYREQASRAASPAKSPRAERLESPESSSSFPAGTSTSSSDRGSTTGGSTTVQSAAVLAPSQEDKSVGRLTGFTLSSLRSHSAATSCAEENNHSSPSGGQDLFGAAPTRSPSPSSQRLESGRSSSCSSSSGSRRDVATARPMEVPHRGSSPARQRHGGSPHRSSSASASSSGAQKSRGDAPTVPVSADRTLEPELTPQRNTSPSVASQQPNQVPYGWSPAFYARVLEAQARREALTAAFLRDNPGFTRPTQRPFPPRDANAALLSELRPQRSQPLKERKKIWEGPLLAPPS